MSRKGNCLDNAVMEDFFGHIKSKLLYLQEFSCIEQLTSEITDYINYYNTNAFKASLVDWHQSRIGFGQHKNKAVGKTDYLVKRFV